LASTSQTASGFDEHSAALTSAGAEAASQSGSALVASALTGLFEAEEPTIRFCYQRTADALSGAARATTAYVHGDVAMAANAQAAAGASPVPALLPGYESGFEQLPSGRRVPR